MDLQVAFHVLSIEQTKEEMAIKSAYRNLLQNTNPEDDPEGFKRLREAYETALAYTREPEKEETKSEPVTDIDFFMVRVEKMYEDLHSRFDLAKWKELFSNPICENLDTSLDVRERVLTFLMDHFYLTHEVFALIDKVFGISDDYESLLQQFPQDFMEYVMNHIKTEDFFRYDRLVYTQGKTETANPDAYIREMMDVKNQIDSVEYNSDEVPEEAEKKKEVLRKSMDMLNDMEAYGVYHPHVYTEKLRIYTLINDQQNMLALCEKLWPANRDLHYVGTYVGEALWKCGRHEEADQIWQEVLEHQPQYYRAGYNHILYLMENKQYKQVRKKIEDLMEIYSHDDRVRELLCQANKEVIVEYQEKLANGIEDSDFPGYQLVTELAWCLFQNDRIEEAIRLLEEHQPKEEEDQFSYTNLYARLLFQNQEYERAIPYLERWKDMLLAMEDDGTEKTKRRLRRKCMAHAMLGESLYHVSKKEKAIATLEDAIRYSEEEEDQLMAMRCLANTYLQEKEYEKTIEISTKIIEKEEQYYPAYLLRQEANYELKNGQEVIYDYYRAIEIYPGYYKPYLLAAEVFYFVDQDEDALNVLQNAKDHNVEFSANMMLLECKVRRYIAESEEERLPLLEIYDELFRLRECQDEQSKERWDIKDDSVLFYEKGILLWDLSRDHAAECLQTAIEMNPRNALYHIVFGDYLRSNKEYQQAIEQYEKAGKENPDSPIPYYFTAICHEATGQNEKAIEFYKLSLGKDKNYKDTVIRLCNLLDYMYETSYQYRYHEESIQYISSAVEELQNSDMYVRRGIYYLSAFRTEEAKKDFEKALTFEENWPAWMWLGNCYRQEGQYEKAIECYELSLQYLQENNADKETQPYRELIKCYQMLQRNDKIAEYCSKVFMLNPRGYDVMDHADALAAQGLYDEAIKLIREHSSQPYHKDVAYLYFDKGDYKMALETIKKSLIEYRKDGISKLRAYQDLADFYECLLNGKKALLNNIKSYNESQTPIQKYYAAFRLCKNYYELGNKEKAKKYAQKAIRHFQESDINKEDYLNFRQKQPANTVRWAWIELCLGNKEKAVAMFESMEQMPRCTYCTSPKCFESVLYLADYYISEGEIEKAIELYEEAHRRFPEGTEIKQKLNYYRKKGQSIRLRLARLFG